MKALVGKMEVKKHAIRQTQDGWVVSFVVHPSDMTPEFAAAPLGTRLMLGYAEYTDEEPAPAKPSSDRSEKAREAYRMKDEGEQATVRAARMCKGTGYWLFVGASSEAEAAEKMRGVIGGRRREIAYNDDVHARFLAHETSYLMHTGQLAAPR